MKSNPFQSNVARAKLQYQLTLRDLKQKDIAKLAGMCASAVSKQLAGLSPLSATVEGALEKLFPGLMTELYAENCGPQAKSCNGAG